MCTHSAASIAVRALFVSLSAVVLALAGCSGSEFEGPQNIERDPDIPGFEDYIGGKTDTGYVGNRAVEIEATFTGRVHVAVPDKSAEELTAIAEALRTNPRSWEHRSITVNVTEQIKYARNVLKAQKLNANLEGGTPAFDQVEVVEGGLVLHYSVAVESLVKIKDLEEQQLAADDLVGRVIEPRVPLVPEGLFDKTGASCTTDPDTGNAVDPEEIGAHNLFYYFDPDREGCPLTEADLVTARYEVHSSLEAPNVYPEYDLLVADGKIDMVIIFGQIKHGELEAYDWGFRSFDSMTNDFLRKGFDKSDQKEDNKGHTLTKTYPGGLAVSIDMWTPVSFADHVPRDESDAIFREAIRTHEIVYYNGHAFYGSLNVLDDPAVYPEGVYQIINMDACWSYAYYTKQIFRNRATDDDPEGYALVDVVNNTEPGITGSERTAVVLYDAIFNGASAVHAGGDASIYSWNNIVKYMNDHAEARAAARWSHKNPEIYGASGVRDNKWQPGQTDDDPTDPDASVFESAEVVTIPDADLAGITSAIEVPAGTGTVEGLKIHVSIEHTYIGDLEVVLQHGDRRLTLHDRQGGSTKNLDLSLSTDAFDGLDAEGVWALVIVDHLGMDEGQLTSWSIEL